MNGIRWTFLASAVAALGALAGCSSSVNGTACPTGESPSCTNGGSCTCVPSGTIDSGGGSFDAGGADSSVTGVDSSVGKDSSTGIDGSVGKDSSTGVDSGTVKDSSIAQDSSTGSDTSSTVDSGGGTCPDNTPFTAITWAPPTPLHQGVCTAAQIAAWASSQSMTTGLGTSGNAACDACIVTPETANAHGPAVTVTQGAMTFLAEFNIGGCVADEDGAKAAGSCGNQLNDEQDCLGQECGSCADFNSPTPSPSGPTALCEQAIFSAGGICTSDVVAPGSACSTELAVDGGADQTCLSVATLSELFTLWCGGSSPLPDAGGGTDSGMACPPTSTSGYTAPTYVAAVAHQGLCTAAQVSAFVTACGDNGTQASCNAWQASNVAGGVADGGGAGDPCGNCIFAPMNNGGTWTDPDGFFSPDYAACIQLTDAAHGTACATAYNDLSGCTGVACDNACPANASATDFQACITAADTGSCATYATGLQSACTTDFADGGAANTCSPGAATGTLDPDLTYIATLICGT